MNLLKKHMEVDKLPREEVINNFIEGFLFDFHYLLTEKNLDVPELPDDVITDIINEYFSKKTLTEANRYIYDALGEYVKGSYDDINWDLGRPAVEETPEYKAWRRRSNISYIWSDCIDDFIKEMRGQ